MNWKKISLSLWLFCVCCSSHATWFYAGGVSVPSSLVTNLVAYWKLDEGSGTSRSDSVGGQTLTDNNTVGSAAGKISNAGDFEFGSATYLSHADSATLSLGTDTDFTLCAWVNMESKPGFSGGIICKNADVANGSEYTLYWNASDDRFELVVGNGSAAMTILANTLGAPSISTWYFVVAWHDSASDLLKIQVNNGTVDQIAYTGGTQDGSQEFRIGAFTFNPGFAFDGLIDEVGFWKRILTAGERTSLYNSGNGLSYPF